jgi:hypothetical protein
MSSWIIDKSRIAGLLGRQRANRKEGYGWTMALFFDDSGSMPLSLAHA